MMVIEKQRAGRLEAVGAMSMTVVVTLDDTTGAYLERIAADQGRTPAEVAAWIISADLRREQTIDAELLDRLDSPGADREAGQSLRRASA